MTSYAIEAEHLRKEYLVKSKAFGLKKRVVKALDDLSFNVEKGEIFALLGPNGAGKTTTMRIIVGALRKFHGKVRILGDDIRVNWRLVRSKVGYMPETIALYNKMTPRRYLRYMGSFFESDKGILARRIDTLSNMLGFSDVLDLRIEGLSYGNKRRIMLALALLNDPEILVLDEPTNGLDPVARVEFRHLIRSFTDEGKTVVISSHVLGEIERIADRICIINKGKVVCLEKKTRLLDLITKRMNTTVKIRARNINESTLMDVICSTLGISRNSFNIEPIYEGLTKIGYLVRFHRRIEEIDHEKIIRKIVDINGGLLEYTPEVPDMENIYLRMIEAKT